MIPIQMLLWCPECGKRHVDVGEFATKVHHTHACQGCGMVWRPAVELTCGVQFLPGFRDEASLFAGLKPYEGKNGQYWWHSDDSGNIPNSLPNSIFELLTGGSRQGVGAVRYETEAAATEALRAAVIAHGESRK